MNYNPKDIFLQRRTETQTFEEHPLVVQPNGVVITDEAGNLVMISSASFLAGTSSIDFAISSSNAISASYADVSRTLKSVYASVDSTGQMIGTELYLSNSLISVNISASAPDQLEGKLWWDKVSHTYAIDALGSRLQIGQENYIRAIAGEYIPNGKAVYLDGSDIDPDVR